MSWEQVEGLSWWQRRAYAECLREELTGETPPVVSDDLSEFTLRVV